MVMLQFFVVWRMTRLQSVGKLPKWQSKYILVVFVAYDDTQRIIQVEYKYNWRDEVIEKRCC